MSKKEFDLYQTITDRIIEQLEKGTIPWHKPWACTGNRGAYNRVTGKSYSLLNQILLSKPGEYMTYKQCQAAGGRVKKGEEASIVVFWKLLPHERTNRDGMQVKEMVPFLRYSNVFHIDQCEGITPISESNPVTQGVDFMTEAEQHIDDYCTRCHLTIHHEEQDRAFYSRATDCVTLPLVQQFYDTAGYYSTLFHELVHSTGHETRLNRLEKCGFGSSPYAKEELIAEIGSSVIMNSLGMETDGSFANSASYIQGWLKALRNDRRMIVGAASKAEKAVNLILDIAQPAVSSEE